MSAFIGGDDGRGSADRRGVDAFGRPLKYGRGLETDGQDDIEASHASAESESFYVPPGGLLADDGRVRSGGAEGNAIGRYSDGPVTSGAEYSGAGYLAATYARADSSHRDLNNLSFRFPLPNDELEFRARGLSRENGFILKSTLWALPGVLTAGTFMWACYAYIGYRANHLAWRIMAGFWLLVTIAAVSMVIVGFATSDLIGMTGLIILSAMLLFSTIAWRFTNSTWLMANARRHVWSAAQPPRV